MSAALIAAILVIMALARGRDDRTPSPAAPEQANLHGLESDRAFYFQRICSQTAYATGIDAKLTMIALLNVAIAAAMLAIDPTNLYARIADVSLMGLGITAAILVGRRRMVESPDLLVHHADIRQDRESALLLLLDLYARDFEENEDRLNAQATLCDYLLVLSVLVALATTTLAMLQ